MSRSSARLSRGAFCMSGLVATGVAKAEMVRENRGLRCCYRVSYLGARSSSPGERREDARLRGGQGDE